MYQDKYGRYTYSPNLGGQLTCVLEQIRYIHLLAKCWMSADMCIRTNMVDTLAKCWIPAWHMYGGGGVKYTKYAYSSSVGGHPR